MGPGSPLMKTAKRFMTNNRKPKLYDQMTVLPVQHQHKPFALSHRILTFDMEMRLLLLHILGKNRTTAATSEMG